MLLLKRLLSIILISIFVIAYMQNVSYCKDMDEIVSNADEFLSKRASDPEDNIDMKSLKDTSNYIYNVLFSIAIVIAVAIGIIIGIQFIIGSAEEQAKIKETLIPYIIGIFIVFGSFTIWKIVITIGSDATRAEKTEAATENPKEYDSIIQGYNKIINTSNFNSMNWMKIEEYIDSIDDFIPQLDNAKEDGLITEGDHKRMSVKVMEKRDEAVQALMYQKSHS